MKKLFISFILFSTLTFSQGGGEPSITVVEDMPQDQGGYVGIQFSGSHYDGNSDVYDVTHYSVWRELDTDGSSSIEVQPTPDDRYFRTNTRNTNAWEYIGDTPAQEFDNYGYTAPTIADSNHIGMFTSNFLVVAHTDDDDVFFVSEPMSGYSVDNIAPADPSNVSFQTFTYTTTLSWDAPVDEDYAYTEVRRDGQVLASGSTFNQFVDESLVPGESYNYEIVHVDVNGNMSREVSETQLLLNGTLLLLPKLMVVSQTVYFILQEMTRQAWVTILVMIFQHLHCHLMLV